MNDFNTSHRCEKFLKETAYYDSAALNSQDPTCTVELLCVFNNI